MAQEYTKDDLKNSNRLFANRLRTRVLEEFYVENLTPKVYVYMLSNGEIIHLLFDNDQFCHLIGFSYFGYNGVSGWNVLEKRNILISKLQDFDRRKREEIRITNFPKILKILDNPNIYLYKNQDMRYKSDYFAVWNDEKRYYKLGIGTGPNGVNYGETFQVSLIGSTDNKEINPSNLLTVNNKFIMPKETFKELYYPRHLTAKNQEAKIKELNTELEELRKIKWEIMINTSTN